MMILFRQICLFACAWASLTWVQSAFAEKFYVSNPGGRLVYYDNANPNSRSLNNADWIIYLFKDGRSPSPSGEGSWGAVTGSSLESVQRALAMSQAEERALEKFFHNRDEFTAFNPSPPVAQIRGDDEGENARHATARGKLENALSDTFDFLKGMYRYCKDGSPPDLTSPAEMTRFINDQLLGVAQKLRNEDGLKGYLSRLREGRNRALRIQKNLTETGRLSGDLFNEVDKVASELANTNTVSAATFAAIAPNKPSTGVFYKVNELMTQGLKESGEDRQFNYDLKFFFKAFAEKAPRGVSSGKIFVRFPASHKGNDGTARDLTIESEYDIVHNTLSLSTLHDFNDATGISVSLYQISLDAQLNFDIRLRPGRQDAYVHLRGNIYENRFNNGVFRFEETHNSHQIHCNSELEAKRVMADILERIKANGSAPTTRAAATTSRPITGEANPDGLNRPSPTVVSVSKINNPITPEAKAMRPENGYEQYKLAKLYDSGKGVTKDLQKAVQLYQKAANQGNAFAQYDLALMYDNGRGVARDSERAVELYKKAAYQGYSNAQNNLGLKYEQGAGVTRDLEEMLQLFAMSANQGNFLGQYNLGRMYQNGKGVAKDPEKAAEFYQKAADQGYAKAQSALGRMYMIGVEVPKNSRKALILLQQAVAQGNVDAQVNLGNMYARGDGVTKDFEKARELYERAAAAGNETAKTNLQILRGKTREAK